VLTLKAFGCLLKLAKAFGGPDELRPPALVLENAVC
jgi:hypothetical protein